MDIYVWVAREKVSDVSDIGYFVYVDAQHKDISGMLIDKDPSKAWIEFTASIIPYRANLSWIEPTLLEIQEFLESQTECSQHTPKEGFSGCDVGRYANAMMSALVR